MGNKGFSYLGLLLVVILATTAGSIVVVTMTSDFGTYGMNETVKKMDDLIVALGRYKTDVGTAPATLNDLYSNASVVAACAASTAVGRMTGWCGPYMTYEFTGNTSDAISDGWGTAFEYSSATSTLFSWGPNKTDNGGATDDLSRTF